MVRRLRRAVGRRAGQMTLSQRFLLTSILLVCLAMLTLGHWVTLALQSAVVRGVASTAAASVASLISHELQTLGAERPLTAEDERYLNQVFEVGSDATATQLLQIRIHDSDGSLLFQSLGGVVDPEEDGESIARARDGDVVAGIVDLTLAAVGPVAEYPITVLKVFTPLRAPDGGVAAVAELYYSAYALMDIQRQVQRDVWVAVAVIGIGVIAALFVLVDWVGRTLARQRSRLLGNLNALRRLHSRNRELQAASEELRLRANSANESLLAQVGSDIHDGPLQLLTLVILRLSNALKGSKKGATPTPEELADTTQLATEAIEDLRSISVGLVLPELGSLGVSEAIRLAITRHEEMTGTMVARDVEDVPVATTMAVKICAYRIAQEALNNAFRHGGAAGQWVCARTEGTTLVLTITNPAAPDQVSPPNHNRANRLGLRGMRFRVESLGGSLDVDIGSAAGTTVTARIPLGAPPVHEGSSKKAVPATPLPRNS